jgi:ankyrin repeat protein
LVSGEKCVHLAAQHNRVAILKLLVKYGADINAKVSFCHIVSTWLATLKNQSVWRQFAPVLIAYLFVKSTKTVQKVKK